MHLVERMINKEEAALRELMLLYGDYLLRTTYLLLKDKETCEEVVQDSFITAYEKIKQLEDPTKLKSWLTSIAVNRCRMQMRKWSWKNVFLNLEWFQHTQEDETVEGPEIHFLHNLENQILSSKIQQLDYKYREVIILFYFNELKISEIAALLKSTEGTVKSRLNRGRILLKQLIMEGEKTDAKREANY